MNFKKAVCNSMLDTIGNTPLINLQRLTKNLSGKILAKIEYYNPGLSKKDRIALQTILDAEEAGILKPGQTIIELTSGNTGTGYAIVCALKGYPFIAVMSKGNTRERARMMAAFGAKVVLVEQAKDSPPNQVSGEDLALVEKKTQELTKELNAFRADQFNLDGNWRAHYLHTANEIIEQTNGEIDAFCDFVGTGGSYAGISKALKDYNPEILCYVVEPKSAAVLSGKKIINQSHKIQGGGYSMPKLKFLQDVGVDGYVQITDEEAIKTARQLAEKEAIFGGFSSGANVAAALRLIKGKIKGKTVVCLICDSGLKYLSTDLWAPLK
ncbi:MAG: PLP-dependent cysteine synthase family protein [Candidatus Hodarchaeota archaeon]